MAKQKKIKAADQAALKHYRANPDLPEVDELKHAKKIMEKALAAKPLFIKPEMVIDNTMAKRKSAVINPLPATRIKKIKKA